MKIFEENISYTAIFRITMKSGFLWSVLIYIRQLGLNYQTIFGDGIVATKLAFINNEWYHEFENPNLV